MTSCETEPVRSLDDSQRTKLRVIRAGELRVGRLGDRFEDPSGHILSGSARDWFLANPVGLNRDDPVQILAIIANKVVGRINLLKGVMHVDGRLHEMQWASGYHVDAEWRGQGIGKALLAALLKEGAIFGALGASRFSFPIFEKSGWTRADAARLVFVTRSLPIVRASIKSRLVARAVAYFLDCGLAVERGARILVYPTPKGVSAEPVASVPSSAFPAAKARVGLFFPRSVAWLEWLMAHSTPSNTKWVRLYVVRCDNGDPIGYFVFSARFHECASRWQYHDLWLGTIKDWQAIDGSHAANLLIAQVALREAMRLNVDAVEICCSDEQLTADLKQLGGRQRGALPLHMLSRPASAGRPCELGAPQTWDFRSADGDHFFF